MVTLVGALAEAAEQMSVEQITAQAMSILQVRFSIVSSFSQ